ncbi:Uncharacterized protein Fot_53706 [Forsythia ovata]|uniref:Uncharacterized protein n=1 Tax=Forsythia ovata TaxID=205694 RepID=A0ABD1PEY0_9LAMI
MADTIIAPENTATDFNPNPTQPEPDKQISEEPTHSPPAATISVLRSLPLLFAKAAAPKTPLRAVIELPYPNSLPTPYHILPPQNPPPSPHSHLPPHPFHHRNRQRRRRMRWW